MESAPQCLKPRKRLKYENHLALIALVTAAPALIIAITLTGLNPSKSSSWAVTIFLFFFVWAGRAAEKIMGRAAEQLLSRPATELGLVECLEGESSRILNRGFPGGGERWSMRRGKFRQAGAENQLVVLTDLSRALREEEREAWQRLLRVLGHELNNSLAPIKSIAASLNDLLLRDSPPADWREDMQRGLEVISSRADSLARFIESYSKLARLPKPGFE